MNRCNAKHETNTRSPVANLPAESPLSRTTPRFTRDYPPTITAHDVGIKDLLDMFYIQGGTHEIILYAITIDPKQPIRMSLSPEGEKYAAEATAKILAELAATF
jgi:hydrogenase maturation protease